MPGPRETSQRMKGEQAAKDLGKLLNCFDRKALIQSFVEEICHRTHRTLQQNIGGLVFALIKKWASMYTSMNYDLRNEDTCRVAWQIVSHMDNEHTNWEKLSDV